MKPTLADQQGTGCLLAPCSSRSFILQPPQGRRACPDPAVLSDAGRGGLPLQSTPESCPDPAGRGEGGTRRAGAGHRSTGGGAEVRH